MGYNKFISYGNIIETYSYGRDLQIPRGTQRVHTRRVVRKSVDDDGKAPLSPSEFEGKRKDNAVRAQLAFRRLVMANLSGSEHPLLVTCTYRDNQTDIRVGYRDFGAFIQALRYRFGPQFRYIAVPEFQARGAVHFHALFWGLPARLFDTERDTRLLAGLWKQGFLYLKQTDGNERLSGYLSKYMAKSFVDQRLMNQKAYVCSRNLKRPVIHGGLTNFAMSVMLEDFQIDPNAPEIDKSYDTHWLGTARHRIYKLSTENPQKNLPENLS